MSSTPSIVRDPHPSLDALRLVLTETGVNFQFDETRSAPGLLKVLFPEAKATLAVAYYHSLLPLQLKHVAQGLRQDCGKDTRVGICVRRMSASLLDACKEQDVAAFDLTGNAYLRMPGIFIERFRRKPAEAAQPVSGSVFTAKAARLVRALLARYPWDKTRAQLARETDLSPGYISILVKRLIETGYASDRQGMIILDEPDRLLDDWVAHYRFDRHRKHAYALAAKTYEEGIGKLADALNGAGVPYAFTGWTGAHLRAPYATPVAYMAYVHEAPQALKGVFPATEGGNVWLYTPQDEGVFQFTEETKEGTVVSDAQLYLDLSRMPGRAREQSDAVRGRRLNFAKRVS